MNREECEAKILEKLKEIKDIAKQYDKSENFYLSMVLFDNRVALNNATWETETPLDANEYFDVKDKEVFHCGN